MGALVAPTDRPGESRGSIIGGSERIFVGDHRRHVSVAEAATALGVSRSSVLRAFDAAGPAAGERDPVSGERLFNPAWVAAEVAARAARAPRSVSASLSVAEAARRLGVSKNTVRRWFDRDQPVSGQIIEGGRTGGTERRCATAWVDALQESLRGPR